MVNKINAQEYLDQNYPKEQRRKIKKLDISGWDEKNRREKPNWQKLTGHLDLSDFINLEKLNCSLNELTSIDLSNNKKVKWIICSDNLLTDIDFFYQDPEKVKGIVAHNNNLSTRDLSCFAHFVNLETLLIGTNDEERIEQNIYNRFYGSLEYLANLKNLEELDINSTDIDDGLEYLPLINLEEFYCATNEREGARVKEIKKTLMINEEEARSDDEEDNRKKVNRILAYQLYHNNLEREWVQDSFSRLSRQYLITIRRIKHKINQDDLHSLLAFQKKAVLVSGALPQFFQYFEDHLRKIKQELIEDCEELTRVEIDKVCQTQIKLLEVHTFLIQNRLRWQETENLIQAT